MPSYLVPDDILSADASNQFNQFADGLGTPSAAPTPSDSLTDPLGTRNTKNVISTPTQIAAPPARDDWSNPLAGLPSPDQYTPGQPSPDSNPLAGLPTPDQYVPGQVTPTSPLPTDFFAGTPSPSAPVTAPLLPSDNALDTITPDTSSREAFIQSATPLALAWQQKTGIPAAYFLAVNGSESNWGRAPGNELFGIKARPGNASTGPLDTWEAGQGAIKDSFSAYPTANAAYADFIDLISHGRYLPAWQQFQQDHDPAALFQNLNKAGYATDPQWGSKIASIASGIGVTSTRPVENRTAPGDIGGVARPSQFSEGLSYADAMAACGPTAALTLANKYGDGNIPPDAVMQAARDNGLWDPVNGMHGVVAEQKLLETQGVKTRLEANVDWNHVASDAANGNPVIISTPGHYFVVDQYDPQRGFHVGTSGTDLKQGAEWMSAQQMQSLEGAASGALYVDNPTAHGPSVAEQPHSPLDQVGSAVHQATQSFMDWANSLGSPLGQAKDNAVSIATNPAHALGFDNQPTPQRQPIQGGDLTGPGSPIQPMQPKPSSDMGHVLRAQAQQDETLGRIAQGGQAQPQDIKSIVGGYEGARAQATSNLNPAEHIQTGTSAGEVSLPVIGGLSTGLLDMGTDPLTYAASPEIGAAVHGVEAVVAKVVGPEIAAHVPQAIKWAADQGLTGGAWGAAQAGVQPNATPGSVAKGFATGAAFGVGMGAATGLATGGINLGGRGSTEAATGPSDLPSAARRPLTPEEQAQATATYRAVAKATHPDVAANPDTAKFDAAAKAYASGDLDTLNKIATDLNVQVTPQQAASADANTTWFGAVKQAVTDHLPDLSGLKDVARQAGAWVYRNPAAPMEERGAVLALASDLSTAAERGDSSAAAQALSTLSGLGEHIASDPIDKLIPAPPSPYTELGGAPSGAQFLSGGENPPRPPATPQVNEPPAVTKYVLPSFVTAQQRGAGTAPASPGNAPPPAETGGPPTVPAPTNGAAEPNLSAKPTQGFAKAGRWANAQVRLAADGTINVKGTLKPVEGWPGDTATQTLKLSGWQRDSVNPVYHQSQLLRDAFRTQLDGELALRGGGGGWEHVIDAARTAVNDAIARRDAAGAAPAPAAPALAATPPAHRAESPTSVETTRKTAEAAPQAAPAPRSATPPPSQAEPTTSVEPGRSVYRGEPMWDANAQAPEYKPELDRGLIFTTPDETAAHDYGREQTPPAYAVSEMQLRPGVQLATERQVQQIGDRLGYADQELPSTALIEKPDVRRALQDQGYHGAEIEDRTPQERAHSTVAVWDRASLLPKGVKRYVGTENENGKYAYTLASHPNGTTVSPGQSHGVGEQPVPRSATLIREAQDRSDLVKLEDGLWHMGAVSARTPSQAFAAAKRHGHAGSLKTNAELSPRSSAVEQPALNGSVEGSSPSAGTEEAPAVEAPTNVATAEAPSRDEEQAPALTGEQPVETGPARYEYQSTQANLPAELATKIERYQRTIDPADLGPGGLESQPHITLKYGLHQGVSVDDVRRILADQPPIRVTFGANEAFPPDENGAPLYISVDSPDLHRLNGMLSAVLPHTETHPEYTPHVTLAYLKPDAVGKYADEASPLTGASTTLDSIAFSDTDGHQVEIPLTGKARSNGRTNGHAGPYKAGGQPPSTPETTGNGGNGKPPAPPAPPTQPPTPPEEPERQHVVGYGYQSGMSPEVEAATQTAADAFKTGPISQADVARAAQVMALDEASTRRLRDAALSDETPIAVASQALRYRARAAIDAVQHFDQLHASAVAKQAQGIELSQAEKESLDEATRAVVLNAAQMDLKASRRLSADIARALNQHKFTVTATAARQSYMQIDQMVAAIEEAAKVLQRVNGANGATVGTNGHALTVTDAAKLQVAAEQLDSLVPVLERADHIERRVNGAATPRAAAEKIAEALHFSPSIADAIAQRPLVERRALDLIQLTPDWRAARAAGDWDQVNAIEEERANLIGEIESLLEEEIAEREGRPQPKVRTLRAADAEQLAAKGVVAKMRRELRERLREPEPERSGAMQWISDQVRKLVLEQEVSEKDLLPRAARLVEMNKQQADARGAGDHATVARIEQERERVLTELRDELEHQARERISRGPKRFTTGDELEAAVRDTMGRGILRNLTAAIDKALHPEREAGRVGEQIQKRTRVALEREKLRELADKLREFGSTPFRQGRTIRTIAGVHETMQQIEAVSAAGRGRAAEIRRSLVKAGLTRYLQRKDVPESRMDDLITMVTTADPDKPEQIAQVLRTLRQPTGWDRLREFTVINMLSSPLTWGLLGTSVLSHLFIGSGRILAATPLDALHEALRYGLRGEGRTMFFHELPEAVGGAKKMLTTPSAELRQIGLTNPFDIYGQIIKNGFTPDAVQSAVELGDLGALRREYLSEGKRFGWLWQWMHRISTRPVEAAYGAMGHVLYGSMLHSLAYREARRLLNSGEWRKAMQNAASYDTETGSWVKGTAEPSVSELRDYILRNTWDFPHVLEQAGAIEDYSLLRSKLPQWYANFIRLRSAPPDASAPRQLASLALHRLLPFAVVPFNFIRMGADTSLLGTAYHASYGYAHAETREKQAEEFRKVLVGSLIAIAGLALLAGDNLTGQGPTDPSKRRLWLATRQPDSVRILGNWVSYNNTFFGIPLAMLANAIESTQEQAAKASKNPTGDELLNMLGAVMLGTLKGTGETIANESFVKTIGDIVKLFTGGTGSPSSLIANQVDAFVPLSSLVALFARMGDSVQRETRTFTEQLASRIPGLREQQPAALNPLGAAQPNDQAGLGAIAGLLPFRPATKPDQNNAVIREYERLGVNLPPAPRTVHSIPLTDAEKHDYEADVGPKIEAAANKMLASPAYQRLDDVKRAKVLKDVTEKLRAGEDALALKRIGADEIKRRAALLKPAAAPSPNGGASAAPSAVAFPFGQPTKSASCSLAGGGPDGACTPGSIAKDITVNQLTTYVKTPRAVSPQEKGAVYAAYGIPSHQQGDYEVDHLVPRALGGADDISNLWPQPKGGPSGAGYHEKDIVEVYLYQQVRSGKMPLDQAQRDVASRWQEIYASMPASERARLRQSLDQLSQQDREAVTN